MKKTLLLAAAALALTTLLNGCDKKKDPVEEMKKIEEYKEIRGLEKKIIEFKVLNLKVKDNFFENKLRNLLKDDPKKMKESLDRIEAAVKEYNQAK